MKLLGVIVLGVLASFTLTILGELMVSTMPTSGWHVYVWILGPEFPLIALVVGTLAGVIMKERAKTAAALSLAPWALWLILGANRKHPTFSSLTTTIALFSIYVALGVGAAAFAVGRMALLRARGGRSPSQASQ